MADTKITALTAITTVDPAADVLPIVDVSDTSMAASGTTKKITSNQILGAGGTATLASATISGALAANADTTLGTASKATNTNLNFSSDLGTQRIYLDRGTRSLVFQDVTSSIENYRIAGITGVHTWGVGGSTAMTLNATGLGVGGSPNDKLEVVGSGSAGIRVSRAGVLSQYTTLSAGATGPSLDASSAIGALTFGVAGSTKMTVDASGNCGIGVTPAGTGGCLQLKSGITFPATQVASSDPNTLDDYEEGSWTPVVADASTGGNTGTCTINSAKYVKIGRQVSVQCDISGITTTGMTAGNAFHIRGLPFTSVQGGSGNFYTYRVGRNASTVSSSAFAPDANSHIIFSLFTTNSATTDLLILVSDIVSTSSQIILSVTYFV